MTDSKSLKIAWRAARLRRRQFNGFAAKEDIAELLEPLTAGRDRSAIAQDPHNQLQLPILRSTTLL